MIDKITLKNFKSFQELKDLPIKPITIISGTNSCGKSSILQSILLMKQTIESINPSQTILMNGRLVHLGTFQNIINKNNIENVVELNFSYKFKKSDIYRSSIFRRRIPINFLLRDLIPELASTLRKNQNIEYKLSYIIKLRQSEIQNKLSNFSRTLIIEECSYRIDAYDNNEIIHAGPQIILKNNDSKTNKYNVTWKNVTSRFDPESFPSSGEEDDVRIEFSNLFPEAIESGKSPKHFRGLFFGFYRIKDLLSQIYSGYSYIGPLREEPSRRYIFEDEVIEIGIKGENAAYIYLAEQETELKKHFFLNPDSDAFEEEKIISLKNAVSRWLSIMGISNFTAEPSNEIIHLMLNSSEYDETKVNIADVGFGVSQIFPIVLEGLRIKESQTLILEQPEIHLHPKLQMLLADYLLSLALSGKKIIVETHSDHLINRLVRRIVEDENSELNKLIGIYFVTPNESGSKFEEIKIDDSSGIVNWPAGFFDQTASEQEKIIKAGLNKRLAKRVSNFVSK